MLVNDPVNFLVTVFFQLSIIHRGCTVPERLLRRQRAAPGQPGIMRKHVSHARAVQQKQVNVSAVRLVIAVSFPIARKLLAHVKYAVIRIMVKQPDGMALVFVYPDIKRNMLVHRVPGLRVMPDGILRAHAKASALFVQMPCLFTKPVKMVGLPVYPGIMAQSSKIVFFKCPLMQILVHGLPVRRGQPERKRLFAER